MEAKRTWKEILSVCSFSSVSLVFPWHPNQKLKSRDAQGMMSRTTVKHRAMASPGGKEYCISEKDKFGVTVQDEQALRSVEPMSLAAHPSKLSLLSICCSCLPVAPYFGGICAFTRFSPGAVKIHMSFSKCPLPLVAGNCGAT